MARRHRVARAAAAAPVLPLFFLSGAASLVYEVAWARSLGLVFGASHLAVATVLCVFMGGLALGAFLAARVADASDRPLRLYGLLEIGVAAGAVAFVGFARIYPFIYGPLARIGGDNHAWLTALRFVFAAISMIVPTTLMGATLPALARYAASAPQATGRTLSTLYAVNTLGAVAGAFGAGFVFLEQAGVTLTILGAAAVSLSVGVIALRMSASAAPRESAPAPEPHSGDEPSRVHRLVLWGIGISGFCALGYEVLWTRMLTLVLGTSVYSFTIILVAFLAGIAAGSEVHGRIQRRRGRWLAAHGVVVFGAVQIAIGVTALAVTILLRDLPSQAAVLQDVFGVVSGSFGRRQAASLSLAMALVFVPALLMGAAFPLAGALDAQVRAVGRAVSLVLAWDTVGAILGSAVSGFVLIQAFGIERSLQMLAALNASAGAVVIASRTGRRWAIAAAALVSLALLGSLGVNRTWGRFWDVKYFAIFRNTQRGVFEEPAKRAEAMENTDVLYYFEGANETISVIRPKDGIQAFLVNGRSEASTSPMDVQCQRTLGHLPMLLHPDPRKVFVLGTGSGMTLGATTLYPGVESIVLAEIEPGALGAARTFSLWNHGALDDPRLRIVFNDGRNFLSTTREKFDVITADPIHPWSGGAAYLYTAEYFHSVAQRLAPGGIAAQWLPLYELSTDDVKTVLATFSSAFSHVAVWLTYYDAEIVGSDSPIVLDEQALARRMTPAIADLAPIEMGSPADFLSYFLFADAGARAFSAGARINTDDNLSLEFSAPRSMGIAGAIAENLGALAPQREAGGEGASLYDRAHQLVLSGDGASAQFLALRSALANRSAGYAPYRFLEHEYQRAREAEPALVGYADFGLLTEAGTQRLLRISAVSMRTGESRAVVMFVDNERRDVFGQRYLDGPSDEVSGGIRRLADATLGSMGDVYLQQLAAARSAGKKLPDEASTVRQMKERVAAMLAAR